ncbi:hypothetical protein EST38_g6505 [Candolleomyces aberdarensis]|uniref:Arrestin-like N-terminal domain-containing protein n=1 Tax=Candolleomyces aberdarensis TaxID=2316362 RepID=A0A4Q2DHG1_9AGAR|nr:hypothetical protein EST38_g6505 [Candolleomyces aberdarensis]
MRRRAMTESRPASSDTASRTAPLAVYSHVSTYRVPQLELQLYSPALKVDSKGPIAVFNDHDRLSGKVVLDWQAYHTGRLNIAIEGSFTYCEPSGVSSYSERKKHNFFNLSKIVNVSPPQINDSSRFFREAFRRRPSGSYISVKSPLMERSYPFEMSLPQGCRAGEELPSSFSPTDTEGDPFASSCEISYKVIVTWEPDASVGSTSHLEVPIILQSEGDFESKDAGLGASGDSWVEMPLKTERPIPIRCAVALPTSVTFCRSSSIPYFVVFTTTPRAPLLTREIAADSTISIALVRQITIQQPQMVFPLTPPPSPSRESPVRLLRRVAKSSSRLNLKRKRDGVVDFGDEFKDKPLPDLPLRTCFSEQKTIFSDFILGFAKRPRHHCEDGSHPTLEEQSSLPDGLHKGKIPLHKEMLPCIDWPGVSVKYYLDISVMNGIDDMRARVPVRIY